MEERTVVRHDDSNKAMWIVIIVLTMLIVAGIAYVLGVTNSTTEGIKGMFNNQPSITPEQPTVSPQPTATPVPSSTPQPTTTPLPTVIPELTDVLDPTNTPKPTQGLDLIAP